MPARRLLPHTDVLHNREYRLLLSAQATSLLGDAMVNIALAFAVIEAGGRAEDLGIVFAARSLALVVSLLAGGVVADRLPRRTILIGADLCRFVTQGAVAALLIADASSTLALAALSAATGAATGFFNPASTGFLPLVVGEAELQEANALRSLASSAGRIFGPLISGALVAGVGAGWALALDAVTYALSAVLVGRMRTRQLPKAEGPTFLQDLAEGWASFRTRRWLWSFVLWISFANLLFGAWTVLGPVVASERLGGAAAWSVVIAASGVGGIAGGLIALRVDPPRPLVTVLVSLVAFFCPLALLAGGLPVAPVAVGAALSEIGLIVGLTVWESTIQRHVPLDELSRVSAYNWFGSTALQPLGLAAWGLVGATLGTREALWLAFAGAVASGVLMLSLRPTRNLRRAPGHAAMALDS